MRGIVKVTPTAYSDAALVTRKGMPPALMAACRRRQTSPAIGQQLAAWSSLARIHCMGAPSHGSWPFDRPFPGPEPASTGSHATDTPYAYFSPTLLPGRRCDATSSTPSSVPFLAPTVMVATAEHDFLRDSSGLKPPQHTAATHPLTDSPSSSAANRAGHEAHSLKRKARLFVTSAKAGIRRPHRARRWTRA